jgi:hypothetical protein
MYLGIEMYYFEVPQNKGGGELHVPARSIDEAIKMIRFAYPRDDLDELIFTGTKRLQDFNCTLVGTRKDEDFSIS